MPITPDQLSFRRIQTDDPRKVTVFCSLDGTLADGTPTFGPLVGVEVALTDAELAMAIAIKDRGKALVAAQMNTTSAAK